MNIYNKIATLLNESSGEAIQAFIEGPEATRTRLPQSPNYDFGTTYRILAKLAKKPNRADFDVLVVRTLLHEDLSFTDLCAIMSLTAADEFVIIRLILGSKLLGAASNEDECETAVIHLVPDTVTQMQAIERYAALTNCFDSTMRLITRCTQAEPPSETLVIQLRQLAHGSWDKELHLVEFANGRRFGNRVIDEMSRHLILRAPTLEALSKLYAFFQPGSATCREVVVEMYRRLDVDTPQKA
jgi:hypothetical protein